MADPQTKRQILARLAGFNAPVHKVSAAVWKRLQGAIDVVRGDGSNRVDKLHDPAVSIEAVTLEIIVEKNEAFVAKARSLFLQHKQNPQSAGPLVLISINDDGSVRDTLTLVRAVIQEVRSADGDVQSHGEAVAQIIVQPDDVIAGAAAA